MAKIRFLGIIIDEGLRGRRPIYPILSFSFCPILKVQGIFGQYSKYIWTLMFKHVQICQIMFNNVQIIFLMFKFQGIFRHYWKYGCHSDLPGLRT